MSSFPLLLVLGLCVLLCLLPGGLAAVEAWKSNRPVALVYALAGEAALMVPSERRRPLRLFDRLPEGTTLDVGPGSRLALAFATGRRYMLDAHSRATLGAEDLLSRSGSVRPLPAVPHLPCLLPIAGEDRPGLRSGAVRIRSESVFSRRRRPLIPVEGDRGLRLLYIQSP